MANDIKEKAAMVAASEVLVQVRKQFRNMYKELADQQESSGVILKIGDNDECARLLVGFDEGGDPIYQPYLLNAHDYQECRKYLARQESETIENEVETYHLLQDNKAKTKKLAALKAFEDHVKPEVRWAKEVHVVKEEYFLSSGTFELSWMIGEKGDYIEPDEFYPLPKNYISKGCGKVWSSMLSRTLLATVCFRPGSEIVYGLEYCTRAGQCDRSYFGPSTSKEGLAEIRSKFNKMFTGIIIEQQFELFKIQKQLLERIIGQFDDVIMPKEILASGWLVMYTDDPVGKELADRLEAYYAELMKQREEAHDAKSTTTG